MFLANMTEKYNLNKLSEKVTHWVGTSASISVHTLIFLGAFLLPFFGFDFGKVLLVLTTAVSLEAIYLAIFIQMTVNRNTRSLEEVEENIDEIQEEVEELGEGVAELGEEMDDLAEDIDEIQEDVSEETVPDETRLTLEKIESGLQKLLTEVELLKNKKNG